MRILFIILFFITNNCLSQIIKEKNTIIIKDSISKKKIHRNNIPSDAFQMNFGFSDSPVWVWARFNDTLNINDNIYNYIYQFNFYYEYGDVSTLYYEIDRQKNIENIDFSNYIIKPYKGDATLKLIGKKNDTLYLFNVLERKKYFKKIRNKNFRRVPTVDIDINKNKVSSYDVRISVSKIKDNSYEIIIIEDNGDINKYDFISNCVLKQNFEISYYDLVTNRIYLLEKNCFLEKIVSNGTE